METLSLVGTAATGGTRYVRCRIPPLSSCRRRKSCFSNCRAKSWVTKMAIQGKPQ